MHVQQAASATLKNEKSWPRKQSVSRWVNRCICVTRGEDVYLVLKEMLTQRGISLNSALSITTGAVTRLKQDNPDITSYHCIHQSVLCSTLLEEYGDFMKTVMKLINFLRASSSCQHRLLRGFLSEVDADAKWMARKCELCYHFCLFIICTNF